MKRIVFCWSGFPQYAARSVGAFVRARPDAEVRVLATRPRVPVEGMERLCGCPVEWLEATRDCGARAVGRDWGEETTVFATGWHVPAFREICRQVRARGGRAICMVDQNAVVRTEPFWSGRRLKEFLRGIRFRLFLRRAFDGFMVPGRSGQRLLEGYGVTSDDVRTGMYSADASLFRAGPPIGERPRRIVFVGQFCGRKNVRRLVTVFRQVSGGLPVEKPWELHLYGCGPEKIEEGGGVVVHPFVQPEALAAEYSQARIFCLPSVDEHWGLVVHEAALSGCVLALSERVGAAEDLLGDDNGVRFDPTDMDDMVGKLRWAMTQPEDSAEAAGRASLVRAGAFGLERFVAGVEGSLGGSR